MTPLANSIVSPELALLIVAQRSLSGIVGVGDDVGAEQGSIFQDFEPRTGRPATARSVALHGPAALAEEIQNPGRKDS